MTRLERYALRPQSLWWFTFLLSIVIAGWTGSTRAQPVADRHQAGHSHGAHSHGKAEMELTIQGSAIRGLFKTPMDSLLGFEHAPKTDAQKKAVSDLRERLKTQPHGLYRPLMRSASFAPMRRVQRCFPAQ